MIDATDTATQALPAVEPRWLALLRSAVQDAGRGGISKVAERLLKPEGSVSTVGKSYSRMYVSQFLNGLNRLPASPDFQRSVVAAFGDGRLDCPHLARDIALGECQAFAAREWKVIHGSGPEKVLHWRACQRCPQNPVHPVHPVIPLKAKP